MRFSDLNHLCLILVNSSYKLYLNTSRSILNQYGSVISRMKAVTVLDGAKGMAVLNKVSNVLLEQVHYLYITLIY